MIFSAKTTIHIFLHACMFFYMEEYANIVGRCSSSIIGFIACAQLSMWLHYTCSVIHDACKKLHMQTSDPHPLIRLIKLATP